MLILAYWVLTALQPCIQQGFNLKKPVAGICCWQQVRLLLYNLLRLLNAFAYKEEAKYN